MSRDGAARIQDALARDMRVMAMAGNWFRVVSFREEIGPEGFKLWYATGVPNSHRRADTEYSVTTVTWEEQVK
jgi:hypothetical protein